MMKQLCRFLLNSLPIEMTRYIDRIRLKRVYKDKNIKNLSYYISKKKQPKNKYVVLRFSPGNVGLFALMRSIVFTIDYWEKRHFIPVIDFEYEDYLLSDKLGEHNIWDKCFKQKKTVKEVLKEDYVLVDDVSKHRANLKTCMVINGNCVQTNCDLVGLVRNSWREYYKKVNQYLMNEIVKSDAIDNVLEKEFYSKKSNKQVILGVMMREEFSEEAYHLMPEERRKIIDLHPRVPNVDETIEIVDQYVKQHHIDKIFLSTTIIETVDQFKNRFGDKVICLERERCSMETYKVNHFGLSSSEHREKLKEDWGDYEADIPVKYVSEVYALSDCDYLLAAPSGGTIGALMFNGGQYKDIKILDDLNQSKLYK